jgi:hypothetical protein
MQMPLVSMLLGPPAQPRLCVQDAVEHYTTAIKALRDCFDKADEESWLDQVVIDAVRDLVATAQRARRSLPGESTTGTLKSVGAEMRSIRAVAYRHDKVLARMKFPLFNGSALWGLLLVHWKMLWS